jgi:hypothetical protein
VEPPQPARSSVALASSAALRLILVIFSGCAAGTRTRSPPA